MAARRSNRGRPRKNWVSRQEHFWTVVQDRTVVANNVIRFNPIVAPTDWVVRAGFSTCTMVRIRGHVSYAWQDATAGGSSIQSAIIVVDADDAVNFNPAALLSYEEFDVLWTRTDILGLQTDATGATALSTVSFEVDVKVKRKLKHDDYVYYVFGNNTLTGFGTGDIIPNMTLRSLLVPK